MESTKVPVKMILIGFAILFLCATVSGKCAKFGHSCFGAHGKRAEINPYNVMSPPETSNIGYGQFRPAPDYQIPANVIDWLIALSKEARQMDSPRLNLRGEDGSSVEA